MIDLRQLVLCVVTGSVMILCGLAPGLLQAIVDGVQNYGRSIDRLRRFPTQPSQHGVISVGQPFWLAWAGMIWIALGVVAHFML